MSDPKERFREMLKDERVAVEPTEPGPSLASLLKEAGGAIWDAAKPMAEHGAHESAALLFRGDAFVMYQHSGQEQDNQGHGLHGEGMKQPEQEIERGGRE
ncbi:hypothetical protein [Zavarzinella formosa]|uniref:hypothetical protein n=1 Tax=Zavarzinella formosa TaxID=360055 RepID=UPI0002F4DE4F|nr:hypothetical protein [Zavarzinella formosa]